MRVGLPESFYGFVQCLEGSIHGGAGIFENLGEGLRCGNGGGAVGDRA